jgi:hypothetical protein
VTNLICDEHLPDGFLRRAEALGVRRLALHVGAQAVLQAGWAPGQAGPGTPPEALVPAYPREAEAVRLWRLRHGTGGTA